MLNYEQLEQKINRLEDLQEILDDEKEQILNEKEKIKNEYKNTGMFNVFSTPEYKRVLERWNENEKRKNNLWLIKLIYQHNARLVFFSENLPLVLDILKKYEGKPYGKKTAEKISDEVLAATGCKFTIHTGYFMSENYYELYKEKDGYYKYNRLNFTAGYNEHFDLKPLLIDNKIAIYEPEQYILRDEKGRYIEDPEQQAEELKKAYKQVEDLYKSTSKAMDAFNELTVTLIDNLYINEAGGLKTFEQLYV